MMFNRGMIPRQKTNEPQFMGRNDVMAAPGQDIQEDELAMPQPRPQIPWKLQAAFPGQQQGFGGKFAPGQQQMQQMPGNSLGRTFGGGMRTAFQDLFSKYRG